MNKASLVLWLVGRVGLAQADDKSAPTLSTLPSTPLCESESSRKIADSSWCKNTGGESDAVNICVDAQTGCITITNGLDSKKTRFIIPPNRDVVVTVHSMGGPSDDIADVSVNLAGSIGLVLPATYGETKDMLGANLLDRLQAVKLVGKACAPKARSYIARFAPRGAGALPLTITIVRDKAAQVECETVQAKATPTEHPNDGGENNPEPNFIDPWDEDKRAPNPADGKPESNAAGDKLQSKPTDDKAKPKPADGKPQSKPADDKLQSTPAGVKPQSEPKPRPVEDTSWESAVRKALESELHPPPPVDCHWAVCTVTVSPPPEVKPAPSSNSAPKGKVFSYELYVPKLFGGALRIGFGAIHVDGLAHSYGVRRVVGADFSQIVDSGADPVSAELVVGYAPFLFAKFSNAGGRTYTADENTWLRFAPFFGVGVLSSSPTASKAEFLRSFYLGIEYEITPGSSVALTAVVRRVDALASGLAVGMTVDSGTNTTRTTFDVGWGLVFNVTPGFFQFATSALPK